MDYTNIESVAKFMDNIDEKNYGLRPRGTTRNLTQEEYDMHDCTNTPEDGCETCVKKWKCRGVEGMMDKERRPKCSS